MTNKQVSVRWGWGEEGEECSMQWSNGCWNGGTCEDLREVQNGCMEEVKSEIKPLTGPDFATLYGPGEVVQALIEGEWEAAAGCLQESNRIRLALNLDHIWHRGMRPPPSSSISLCICPIASTSSLNECCLFPFKTLGKSMKWAWFVPRTGYITTFLVICFSW